MLRAKIFILILTLGAELFGCGCMDPDNAQKNSDALKSLYDKVDSNFADIIIAVNELNTKSIEISNVNRVILEQNVGVSILKGVKGAEALKKSIILKELR